MQGEITQEGRAYVARPASKRTLLLSGAGRFEQDGGSGPDNGRGAQTNGQLEQELFSAGTGRYTALTDLLSGTNRANMYHTNGGENVRKVSVIKPNANAAFGGSGRKLRVAAYARVSSSSSEQLESFSAQVKHYTDLIQNNPEWLFAGIYADRESAVPRRTIGVSFFG